jgi:putative aldouronate transport system permease protein
MSAIRRPLTFFDVFNSAFMVLMGLVTIFPFYYVLIISLSDYASVQRQLIYIFPTNINLESYAVVFKDGNITRAFFVSVFVTVVGTAYSMVITALAAYTLSKKNIPFNKLIFAIVIIPMFFSGGLIPYYLTIKAVGLMGNLLVLIIPSAITTFYLILMKNSFDDVPPSIEESAKIDGANDFTVFFKIVLPTSGPVIATIALFYAVDKWNAYYEAMLFLSRNRKLLPLQAVLRDVIQNFNMFIAGGIGAAIAQQNQVVYQRSLQMAVIVVATIPILCVYPFLQKHFTKGIMLGAVKE